MYRIGEVASPWATPDRMGKLGPSYPLMRRWRVGVASGLYIMAIHEAINGPKLRSLSATSKYSHDALSNAFSWSRLTKAAPNLECGGGEGLANNSSALAWSVLRR